VSKISLRFSRLEVIAFVTGFVLMVFELAGARILAPGIGSSTYVWTSVIGIIIAALSLGYWAGGRLADTRGHLIDVARLCLLSALLVGWMMLQYEGVISWVASSFTDPRIQGVVASLILFAPTSFILGMISPYLAKLNVKTLKRTGQSIASLSALNSVGGIIGTFVAGFILFGYIGSHATLALAAVLLLAVSWLADPRVQLRSRVIMSLAVLSIVMLSSPVSNALAIDTPSARYSIIEQEGKRLIATGPNAAQSGIILSHPEHLAFWYTQQLADVVAHAQSREKILVLGGGVFTLPQYLAHKYPDSTIDVVEIDPVLARIARQYFNYTDPSNIRLFFTDARTYVNQTDERYDVIIVDVYGDTHIPFTLMTKEYGEQINRILNRDGIVAANLIAGMKNECRTLLDTLNAPYLQQLEYSNYRIQYPDKKRSNMVVAYSRQPLSWPASLPTEMDKKPPFTDDYAPAERLQHNCRRE
jgi:spermidine synthase